MALEFKGKVKKIFDFGDRGFIANNYGKKVIESIYKIYIFN